MNSHAHYRPLPTVLRACAVLFLCAATALAAGGDTARTTPSPQSAQLMQKLEAARRADWNAALDPTVSPVNQETFLNQMNKADRVARELGHGYTVPQSEIDDALWSPPRHISPAERQKLIQQLEAARQQDDHNEQLMLNDLAWSRSAAPAETAIFDERKHQVDQVIKNLEIGAPVHWSTIRQALEVPKPLY